MEYHISDKIKFILKSSRFPHFWIWLPGYISFGWLYARLVSGRNEIFLSISSSQVFELIIICIWVTILGNIYLNNINDAFDSETDLVNPRKNGEESSIEQLVDKKDSTQIFKLSLFAAATILVITPFISIQSLYILLFWIVAIFIYNVPGLRFKKIPLLETIFATFHFTPLFVLGYVLYLNSFPEFSIIIWNLLYTSLWVFIANSLDVPYDKIAGIKNITVYIGSTRKSLFITLYITIAYILYTMLYLKMHVLATIGICIALLILYLLLTKTYEKSHTTSYKYYIWVTYLTGLSTGFAFYAQIV